MRWGGVRWGGVEVGWGWRWEVRVIAVSPMGLDCTH